MSSEYWKWVRTTTEFRRMRRIVLSTEDVCYLCGVWVDKSLGRGMPGSPEIDHIIALSNGGDPFERDNLALTHKRCNQLKGDRVLAPEQQRDFEKYKPSTDMPLTTSGVDWTSIGEADDNS